MLGKRISDRYKLIELIGDGGMALVYKASDLILDRTVAVKILRSEFSTNEEFIKRFHREAESATSLNHPNVVTIYDVGEENGVFFIVMEYIEGKTLKDLIRELGVIPVPKAIKFMEQIASAIAHAHDNHIVHRDIKPHNILIDKEGVVKVTDFGIALAATSATITHTNSILGSVHYFSPEQAKGSVVNAKSDIYSMGIVLFEMVTGSLPFSGESPVSIALKHLQEKIPHPKMLNSSIPQSVENVILKALAKDPSNRYGNVREFKESIKLSIDPSRLNEPKLYIEDMEDAEATKIITPITPVIEQMGENKKDNYPSSNQKKKKKRKKWLWIILTAFLLLGIAGASALTVLPNIFYVKDVPVPEVVGSEYEDAYDQLREIGLKVQREDQSSEEVDEGKVIAQDPDPDVKVKEGSPVTLTVSTGPPLEEMDNYVGQSIDIIDRLNLENKYRNVIKNQDNSETIPEGEIISQVPSAGEMINPSKETLYIVYSGGPEPIKLENLVGMTLGEVDKYIANSGLTLAEPEKEYSDKYEEGAVTSQSPAPGVEVEKGATITITISQGPEPKNISVEYLQSVEVKENDNDNDEQEKESYDVEIIISDAGNNGTVWKRETIRKRREYTIPLIIAPGKTGSFILYVDGEEYNRETITYDEAKEKLQSEE
jgi:beta-lactam-binding protein with PASTA domain/predicted Ser/Thr protein kinase